MPMMRKRSDDGVRWYNNPSTTSAAIASAERTSRLDRPPTGNPITASVL
jgi:hypothetical protein